MGEKLCKANILEKRFLHGINAKTNIPGGVKKKCASKTFPPFPSLPNGSSYFCANL